MKNINTPYSSLDPNLILNAIESVGFRCNGSLSPLNSYENRVYQVGIEDSPPLIAKFYRPNRWNIDAILEEHQFSSELLSHDIPVVAPISIIGGNTLHSYESFNFALFPRQGGRCLELDNLEHLEWMGRFIGRLHAVGTCLPFRNRMRLDIQSYGYNSLHFLIENDFLPPELKQNYCNMADDLLKKVEQTFQLAGSVDYIRLHGDCHAGNVLWNDTGPQIVDLDDCLMGPAIQDIWMLVSGIEEEADLQLNRILKGYREFHDFNYREIHLIEALRILRMLHYSAWLAKRWEDPTFPINFPWFNTQQYWHDQYINLHNQSLLLDELKEKLLY